MKAVTKYQAEDGTEFASEVDCIKHESECSAIDRIIATLPNRPENDGCAFSNGAGYIQHDKAQFLAAYKAILQIAMPYCGSTKKWFDQTIEDPISHHPSWVGRAISDCCGSHIWRAFSRFNCTDMATMREYGQPYFAANPQKCEGGRINPC